MTIQQIQYFLAVIKHGSFTTAANELYISQSSLSKQIRSLEKELGVKLFIRDTRNVYLSSTGSAIQLQARKLVTDHEKMLVEIERHLQTSIDTISIGTVPVLNHYGISEHILAYQKRYPTITFNISETTTSTIFQMLDQYKIDIGIIRTAVVEDSCYSVYPLLTDEFVLLVSSEHPLAQRTTVNLSEMENNQFLLMNSDPYHSKYYTELFSHAGIAPHVQSANMRLDTIRTWVRQGAGVTIVMKKVADYMNDPSIKELYLEQHPKLSLVAVARKEDMSFAAQSFVEHLVQAYAENQ